MGHMVVLFFDDVVIFWRCYNYLVILKNTIIWQEKHHQEEIRFYLKTIFNMQIILQGFQTNKKLIKKINFLET